MPCGGSSFQQVDCLLEITSMFRSFHNWRQSTFWFIIHVPSSTSTYLRFRTVSFTVTFYFGHHQKICTKWTWAFFKGLSSNMLTLIRQSRADRESSVTGGRDTLQLYRYYVFYWELFKSNRKYQRKTGGCGLYPPMTVIESEDAVHIWRTFSGN